MDASESTTVQLAKICSRCSIEKTLEEFSLHKDCLYGRASWCKQCYAAYYQETKEQQKLKQLERIERRNNPVIRTTKCIECNIEKCFDDFYENIMNKDKKTRKCKSCIDLIKTKICTQCHIEKLVEEFHISNKSPDRRKIYCKSCNHLDYERKKDRVAEQGRQYRKKHKKKEADRGHSYYLLHREDVYERTRKRRARIMSAPVNDFTTAQWLDMQCQYDHRCAYCGKRAKGRLTQDHITPLINGGSHTLSNIVPACKSCNSRKHTGSPLSPVQPMLLSL